MPTYDKSTARLTRLDYDGNGKHDTCTFMNGARLIRLEADENEDGKVGPDGSLDRIEVDPSGSGQFPPVTT